MRALIAITIALVAICIAVDFTIADVPWWIYIAATAPAWPITFTAIVLLLAYSQHNRRE